MVVFHFKHELERLQKRFGGKVPVIAGGVSASATDDTVRRWNEGRLPLLFVQPQAMSHGLNMQRGGHDMAWLGLADDLEVYRQTIARLWRQGQQGGVRIHRVFADRTVDLAIRDRLDDKSQAQQSLLRAIQRYQQSR